MPNYHEILRELRRGIMLHYDGSTTDVGAVAWLRDDPRARVSYNWLVLDNGAVHAIAPMMARAWHAGACRPSDPVRLPYHDANSAFFGLSIAAKDKEVATPQQFEAVVQHCAALCRAWGWTEELWRITTHAHEAWPRGRKMDTGTVLPVDEVRTRVAELLN